MLRNSCISKESIPCALALHVFSDLGNRKDVWRSFHHSAITIFRVLELARYKKLPFILIVPQKHDGLSPVDDQAPFIEGARVALAWTSAYSRFCELGNLDIRVIFYPGNCLQSDVVLKRAVANLLSNEIEDNTKISPEERIKERFFLLENLLKNNNTESKIAFKEIAEFTETDSEDGENTAQRRIVPKFKAPINGQHRILVTGGAGFIGSHIVKYYIDRGHQVIALDNLLCGSEANLFEFQQNENFQFFNVDVTRPFDVEGSLTHIIHLASVPSPVFYYTKPKETLLAGLQGTKHTLDLAVKKNARYLFTSTSEVYGDPEISPQTEGYAGNVSTTGKRSQYDQSKRGGETLIKLYFDRYNIDARIVRLFNTYGPNMRLHDGRVVTNFIASLLENKPLTIYGDGLQTRSFAYVSDTVEGIVRIFATDDISEGTSIHNRIFNVGNSQEFTILELAQKFDVLSQKYFGRKARITHLPQPDPSDPKVRCPDLTRAYNLVGYVPKISPDEGLEETLLYFMKKQG